MPSQLSVHAEHQGDMRWTAATDAHSVRMDYPLQPGVAGEGMKPLEMLLASLAACAGNTLVLLLRRAGQAFRGMEIDVRGLRRDEHPTVLTEIALDFTIRGEAIDPAVVERAISQTEERLCPVWAMLKPGTTIKSAFRIVAD